MNRYLFLCLMLSTFSLKAESNYFDVVIDSIIGNFERDRTCSESSNMDGECECEIDGGVDTSCVSE